MLRKTKCHKEAKVIEELGMPVILLVDDAPSNLASLGRVFEREGFQVLKATDGKEALEAMRRQRQGLSIATGPSPPSSPTAAS